MSLASRVLPLRTGWTLTLMPWVMGGILFVLLILGLGVCGVHFTQQAQKMPVLTIELPSFVAHKPTLIKTLRVQLSHNPVFEKTEWVARKELTDLEERLGVSNAFRTAPPVLIHVWSSKHPTLVKRHLQRLFSAYTFDTDFLVHPRESGRNVQQERVAQLFLGGGIVLCVLCFLAAYLALFGVYMDGSQNVLRVMVLLGAKERLLRVHLLRAMVRVTYKMLAIAACAWIVAVGFLYIRGDQVLIHLMQCHAFWVPYCVFLCGILAVVFVFPYCTVFVATWRLCKRMGRESVL